MANWLDCSANQIFFTSGSTQSANWIIQTFAPRWEHGNYIFASSMIEHPAVRNSIGFMERCGYTVKRIDNDNTGTVLFPYVHAVDGAKTLVCVMDSNNQIGTIEPTQQIATQIHNNKDCYLLTDMTQSCAHSTELDLTYLGCDFAIGSGQKFGAPRGTGFLYARDPEMLYPFIFGGHQENGLRGGTENLAGIYAMAKQFNETAANRFVNHDKVVDLRKYLLNIIPSDCVVNNTWDNVLPGIISIMTPVLGEQLVAALSMDGICISAGSACSTGSSVPSQTLKAIGMTDDEARRTVRVSLSAETTRDELDTFVKKLENAITMLQ